MISFGSPANPSFLPEINISMHNFQAKFFKINFKKFSPEPQNTIQIVS
jgi:hypothetical protein